MKEGPREMDLSSLGFGGQNSLCWDQSGLHKIIFGLSYIQMFGE